MAKRLTVFYSWQSDTPSALNRNFIEKALAEALRRLHSDAALEEALRDAKVELDKDTKGVAGSPPIADTILQKVQECAVFVADLTFVGQSKEPLIDPDGKPRQFPNPNVLIEYGYALRCHSHDRLVGIINTAYGKPDAGSLPFDLRHLRWPITYCLADQAAVDRDDQFERLVATLVDAVGLILSKHPSQPIEVAKFVPRTSTKNDATFFDDAKDIVPEGYSNDREPITVPEGGKAYLRLWPTVAVPAIETELEAVQLAMAGFYLQPMGKVEGYGVQRNMFGAISCESPRDGKLYHFTQLFLSREVWGVDAYMFNSDERRKVLESRGAPGELCKCIPINYAEQYFVMALQNYLAFAKEKLQLPEPLRIEGGLVGIKGYSLVVDDYHPEGNALRDVTKWEGEADYEKPASEILAPLFNKLWANCGVQRTPQRQAWLTKQFRMVR